jgi:nucleotide-binding universal stress UspA family protein
MFTKIIWATDGSRSADAAMPIAKQLAQSLGCELTVLHAVQVIGPHEEGTGQPMRRDEADTRAKIEGQVAELTAGGLSATLKAINCPIGAVAHAIAEAAADGEADLIVVGTRGHTALSGLLLGSVSLRLMHISTVPVLAVPPLHAQ